MLRATSSATDRERDAALRDVALDCLRRLSAGEEFLDASIEQAHPELMPELACELAELRRIHAAGQLAQRVDTGTQQETSTSSVAVLTIRCPECHTPAEVVADSDLKNIGCASCGSEFSLVGGEDASAGTPLSKVGHFQLIEQIGIGGFGAVWKAYDTQLDRQVAIKLPRRGQLDSNEAEQFLREARAAAQLRHPNIVSVHEVGRDGERIYLVSDLVEGVSLAERILTERMSAREAAGLCKKIAEALEHAHSAGIVHRDLKPANVLLDSAGEPHLTDFGLARRQAQDTTVTVEGQFLGTPAYMSPEQARGESHAADQRSDVYSLGVILYELLAGEVPFRGDPASLLHQIIHEEPRRPRAINRNVPRDLETITLKCLEKDPLRRYSTANELAEDLGRFLRGEPIVARPLGRAERAWRWCGRNPRVAGLSASVAALLLVVAAVTSYSAIRSNTAAREAMWQRYLSDMHVAMQAWEEGDLGRTVATLNRHVPTSGNEDLRRFEWYYLWGCCQKGLRAPRLENVTRAGSVNVIAISPDGSTLASAGSDRDVKLWDRTSASGTAWKLRRTLTGHPDFITGLAFSPDGKKLASVSADTTVKLWEVATGRLYFSLGGQGYHGRGVAFSPDGTTLVAGDCSTERVKRWDVATGKILESLEGPASGFCCESVAFSPDGSILAAGLVDGTLVLWSMPSGKAPRTLDAHASNVGSVAFSPDSKTLASASLDQTIKLWDATTLALKRTITGHKKGVTCLDFSEAETLVSGGLDGTVRFWDMASGRELGTIRGHSAGINSVALLPDGKTLASASGDNTVKFWDVGSNLSTPMRHSSFIYDLAFSRDGTTLASGGDDDTLMLWNATSRARQRTIEAPVWGLAYSPDGKMLATAGPGVDNAVRLFDVATGKNVRSLLGHRNVTWKVSFSPNGKILASTGDDRTIRLWDVATGENFRIWEGNPCRAAFSPDGNSLAGGADEVVKLWDIARGTVRRTFTGHASVVECVAFSPDGAILASGSADQTVRLWDTATGEPIRTLVGHTGPIGSVMFSPDGATLVSASVDWTVKLWEVADGEERCTLAGHADTVSCVAFSPDGKTLASCSFDKTVMLWPSTGGTPADRNNE